MIFFCFRSVAFFITSCRFDGIDGPIVGFSEQGAPFSLSSFAEATAVGNEGPITVFCDGPILGRLLLDDGPTGPAALFNSVAFFVSFP